MEHELLATIVSSIIVLSFAGLMILVAIGSASLAPINGAFFALYSAVVTMSLVQVVGKGTAKVWSEQVRRE